MSQSLRISPFWLVPVVLFSALALLAPSEPPAAPVPALIPQPEPELPKAEPQPAPMLPEPAQKSIRVGLTLRGGAFAVWSKQPLLITDGGQPGRTLTVKAEDTVTFVTGAVARLAVPGQKDQSGAARCKFARRRALRARTNPLCTMNTFSLSVPARKI